MNEREEYIEMSITKIQDMMGKKIERIYLGSYFCERFFLKFRGYQELIKYCKEKKICATLVVPVFSQNTLCKGKQRIYEICECLESLIDEVTVNDLGMLYHIETLNKYKVNLG